MTIALLCLGAATAPAQTAHHAKREPHPVHKPRLRLDPLRAFRHLESGANRAAADRAARLRAKELGSPKAAPKPLPKPAKRPPGARRYLAAVVACADGDFDVPELLLQHRSDLLLISNPGPVLRTDELRLLDEKIERDQLPLCIVLVHAKCSTAEHRAKLRRPAKPLSPGEYGTIVARHLLRQSKVAAEHQMRGEFDVAVGVVDESGAIEWHAPWVDAPPIDKVAVPHPKAGTGAATPAPRAQH